MKKYPLTIYNDRELPSGYDGPVYVWDIDKTYLSTRFSSLKGLARIPVEFAIDKKAIPGMPEILRGLRRGPGPQIACLPLYFISASPPFLRTVLEDKMLRDGVEQDGIIFKDWLGTLLALKPGRLWEQLGFKLIALLTARLNRLQATEYLFGDDTEKDPIAFSIYAKILDGELRGGELENILKESGVSSEDRDQVQRLIEQMGMVSGKVAKIFIHLENFSNPLEIQAIDPRVVAVKGAYQIALVLRDLNLVDAATVAAASLAVSSAKGYRYSDPVRLLTDAEQRSLVKVKKSKIKKSTKIKRPIASKIKK